MRALWAALAMACASVATSARAQAPTPVHTPAELTADQWRADLRFMVGEMERRHPNLYHHVSRAAFQAEVADLDRRIPTLKRNQLIVGMMRIAAMVGDGHTRIEPRKDKAFGFPSLPLRLYLFEDGLFVRAAAPAQSALVGAKVEAIGGVPVDEAVRRVSALASGENMMGPRLYAPIYLGMPDILQAVGLAPSRTSATLALSRDGRRWTVELPVGEMAALWPPDTDGSFMTPAGWLDARRTAAQPLWLQAPLDYHRLVDLPDRRALYAQLNMITNTDKQSLTQFGERIAERSQASNPQAIVLDVRLAQGGDGSLLNRFVRSLIRAEDDDTRLFVLTARGSFSATQFLLDDLDRLSDAIIIGEPASSRPTGYGDSYRSVMPNSKVTVRTSIKRWQSGQDIREWTPVNVAVPLTFAAYRAGLDPALEAALNYRPKPSFVDQVIADAKRGADIVRPAGRWMADPVNRYADKEGAMVDALLALQSADQPKAALSLVRWAAAQFPASTDLASLHAAIAEGEGLTDEARRAGEAAIRIDPNNRFARSLLERFKTP